MDDTQINDRQQLILDILLREGKLSRSKIAQKLPLKRIPTKITLSRDLSKLQKLSHITSFGKSRATQYSLLLKNPLLSYLDLEQYFLKGPDKRDVLHPKFNSDVLNNFSDLFTSDELKIFDEGSTEFFKKLSKKDDILQRKELQRFIIEFSWKSSQIEGNTYSLFETENLIANRSESSRHTKAEAIMILNHKNAFDHVLTYKPRFKNITIEDIFSIHAILTKDLSVAEGIRTRPVRITGTRYLPLEFPDEIKKEFKKLLNSIHSATHPAECAFIILAGIAYLQPFEDGNKRTSRMVSNAVLLANDFPPLSYRSVDEDEYRKSVVAFYERNTLHHLKRIFMEQFRFARENYFL